MANNAVTNTTYSSRSLATLGDDIETYLETIDEARTIRVFHAFRDENGVYHAIVITDDA